MTILDEAAGLVDGERQADYGHPADDFLRVTDAAKALGINPLSGPLHHALYMVLVKLSRLVQTPDHHDSIVDIAGYARTYEKVLEREKEREISPTVITKVTNPDYFRPETNEVRVGDEWKKIRRYNRESGVIEYYV